MTPRSWSRYMFLFEPFALTALAQQASTRSELISDLVLPAIGVGVIVFCIASFFFPFGQRFKETKQTIRGFGVDLEISVLTLFLLIGFAFSLVGVYLHLSERSVEALQREHDQAVQQRDQAREELNRARQEQKAAVYGNLVLDGGDLSEANPDDLECRYRFQGNDVVANVHGGPGGPQIMINDTGLNDVIEAVQLWQRNPRLLIGTAKNIWPRQAYIKLEPPK
jgi:hypothetical protein